MYLFFDTETTGLPLRWKAPVTDLNNWPRLVQIAWLLYDTDGNKISGNNFIIKPNGFTIPLQASQVHGISTSRAMQEGVDLTGVLIEFSELIVRSDHLVAHNMSFDEKIVGAELLRNKMTNHVAAKSKICTMLRTVDYCKLRGPYGYKWPKLSELHIKLFGKDFSEAHNAAADIHATAKCFWRLKELGMI